MILVSHIDLMNITKKLGCISKEDCLVCRQKCVESVGVMCRRKRMDKDAFSVVQGEFLAWYK